MLLSLMYCSVWLVVSDDNNYYTIMIIFLFYFFVNFRRCTFVAIGLRAAIDNMAGYEDDALQIQITVFEEHQLADENQAPLRTHQELLDKLRSKVRLRLLPPTLILPQYFPSYYYKNIHYNYLYMRLYRVFFNFIFSIFRYRTRCTIRIYRASCCT